MDESSSWVLVEAPVGAGADAGAGEEGDGMKEAGVRPPRGPACRVRSGGIGGQGSGARVGAVAGTRV